MDSTFSWAKARSGGCLGYDIITLTISTRGHRFRAHHIIFDDIKHAFERTANFQVETFGAGTEHWKRVGNWELTKLRPQEYFRGGVSFFFDSLSSV